MSLQLPSAVRNSLPNGLRAWSICEATHIALVRMLEGTSEDEADLWKVAMSTNLAWARLSAIRGSEAGQRLCEAAGRVLYECEEKHGGRTLAPFSREQRQTVIDAVDLYEEVVRASSPLQLENAQKQLIAMAKPKQGKKKAVAA